MRLEKRTFLEALLRDAAAAATLDVAPARRPAAALTADASLGEFTLAHGRDMLTHTDVHRAIAQVPAPPPEAPDPGPEGVPAGGVPPPPPTGGGRAGAAPRRSVWGADDDEPAVQVCALTPLLFFACASLPVRCAHSLLPPFSLAHVPLRSALFCCGTWLVGAVSLP